MHRLFNLSHQENEAKQNQAQVDLIYFAFQLKLSTVKSIEESLIKYRKNDTMIESGERH